MNLKSLFCGLRLPKVPTNTAEDRRKRRKKTVKQVSNGNVLLQAGYYLTEEDISKAKRKLHAL